MARTLYFLCSFQLLLLGAGCSDPGAPPAAASPDELAQQEADWNFHGGGQGKADGTGNAKKVFLRQHGAGNTTVANAYYARNIPGFTPGAYTLTQWIAENMGSATAHSALYQNLNELGFWREMTCSQTIGRGVGGCWVRNWASPEDARSGVLERNKGTVAMNISLEGFTRFYVFLPNGVLTPSAVLDSEGPKFVPQLCTVCHGGTGNPAKTSDLGAIFREFEPSELEKAPGITREQANQQWYLLNQDVAKANRAIRGEAEGAPQGTAHATAQIIDHIFYLHPVPFGGEPRRTDDPFFIPPSWSAGGIVARAALWKDVVNPYCMPCHRHNLLDWSSYSAFEYLQHGGLLRKYLAQPASHDDLPVMPQSEKAFVRLSQDALAQAAINQWLGTTTCQGDGRSCILGDSCRVGVISCATGGPVCRDAGAAPDGRACGAGQVCRSGQCVFKNCREGAACAFGNNACRRGTISCASGAEQCVDAGAVPNGTSCGTDAVCSNGGCIFCRNGVPCTPPNVCHLGQISCATGFSACADTGQAAPNGTSCGFNATCSFGSCVSNGGGSGGYSGGGY